MKMIILVGIYYRQCADMHVQLQFHLTIWSICRCHSSPAPDPCFLLDSTIHHLVHASVSLFDRPYRLAYSPIGIPLCLQEQAQTKQVIQHHIVAPTPPPPQKKKRSSKKWNRWPTPYGKNVIGESQDPPEPTGLTTPHLAS